MMDWLVAGDDLLVCIEKGTERQFEYGVHDIYSPTLNGKHGLGQCVKEITYNQANTF